MPGIDTPKEVTPTNFAYCYFANACLVNDNLNVESNGLNVVKDLKYLDYQVDYKKVNAGISYLRVLSQDNINSYLNMPVNFSKSSHYTFITYGSGSVIKALFIADTFKLPNPNYSNLRFINLNSDYDNLKIESTINKFNSKTLSFKSFSSFESTETGIYNFNIKYNDSTLLQLKNQQISPNKIYNFIIKGSKSNPLKPVICQICEINPPN